MNPHDENLSLRVVNGARTSHRIPVRSKPTHPGPLAGEMCSWMSGILRLFTVDVTCARGNVKRVEFTRVEM